jgi:hypothetical protein
MTSPEKIAQYNEYLLDINPLNEFRKLIGAPIVEPLLPNFCRGGNSDSRNNWENNADKGTGKEKGKDKKKGSLYASTNARQLGRQGEGGPLLRYLPGSDPNMALNLPMPPPDGKNTYYSNTGTDGRYKDTKAVYEHDYVTTINLGIGILLTLYIISQKD